MDPVTATEDSIGQVDLNDFVLTSYPSSPRWRAAQRGALEAISSHWTLEESEPVLVSMPTGSGKTAVALALRYIARSRRALIVVPSQDLRRQIAAEFTTESTLLDIGALVGESRPRVHEHIGRSANWDELRRYDVVVAIPSSISPAMIEGTPLPADLFDLVVIDEAHHAPARTWKAILEHFSGARAVLLTATPRRRDGKSLPGLHLFHYPLRLALKHQIYKPVRPELLDLVPFVTAEGRDEAIINRVVSLASQPEHVTSAVLIRAATVDRAIALAGLYSDRGLECEPLNYRQSSSTREHRIEAWRRGSPRALAVVDMLGEGMDVPNLRIVGYHDKHKSATGTVQLFGRLARSNEVYPQDSVLVTVRDQDVYPALRGSLRRLYDEDPDWATVLPGLIDADVEAEQRGRDFVAKFDEPPAILSLTAMRPLARITVYESTDPEFEPVLLSGQSVGDLESGRLLRGQEIVYSGVDPSGSMLVVVTAAPVLPRWYFDDSLTQARFDLHVVTWHRSSHTSTPDLMFINSEDAHIARELRQILDPDSMLRLGRPEGIQAAFESIERLSVSNVGVRNTHRGGVGTTTYATFAGPGVDRGLREADTHGRGLGHAMAQVTRAGVTVNVGFSAAKAKYWETRYIPLRDYLEFATDFAGRYWLPQQSATGALLPDVARATRTETFADRRALVAEFHPSLRGVGWMLEDHTPLEDLDIEVGETHEDAIELQVVNLITGKVVWTGTQSVAGGFLDDSGMKRVRRGAYQTPFELERLLHDWPPNIYMSDGSVVVGYVTYAATQTQNFLPPVELTAWDWGATDITTESKVHGRSDTIHDLIETKLSAALANNERWVLCNDGKQEIADHIVIDRNPLGRIRVELWHSKASSSKNPDVRVKDMQVVTMQALKSRRHLTDSQFWTQLGRRLSGLEVPKAVHVSGDKDGLLALCGLIEERYSERIDLYPPRVDGKVVVVQPGLSIGRLKAALSPAGADARSGQVREFLIALHNGVSRLADVEIIGSV